MKSIEHEFYWLIIMTLRVLILAWRPKLGIISTQLDQLTVHYDTFIARLYEEDRKNE